MHSQAEPGSGRGQLNNFIKGMDSENTFTPHGERFTVGGMNSVAKFSGQGAEFQLQLFKQQVDLALPAAFFSAFFPAFFPGLLPGLLPSTAAAILLRFQPTWFLPPSVLQSWV